MSALPCILVIEHDKVLHGLYVQSLSQDDWLVLGAHTVAEAVQCMTKLERLPDIVLLDLKLPGMNGLSFLEAYSPILYPELTVIVFTMTRLPEESAVAYALGADRCIFRIYITPGNLRHMVTAIIREKQLKGLVP